MGVIEGCPELANESARMALEALSRADGGGEQHSEWTALRETGDLEFRASETESSRNQRAAATAGCGEDFGE